MQQVCQVQISRLALLLEVLQLLQHVRWMSLKHEGKSRFLPLFQASSIVYCFIFIFKASNHYTFCGRFAFPLHFSLSEVDFTAPKSHIELKLRVTHSVTLVPNPANIYCRNLHIVLLICGTLISEMAGNDLLNFHVNSLPLC